VIRVIGTPSIIQGQKVVHLGGGPKEALFRVNAEFEADMDDEADMAVANELIEAFRKVMERAVFKKTGNPVRLALKPVVMPLVSPKSKEGPKTKGLPPAPEEPPESSYDRPDALR
jgi:hypothetical protein